MKGVVEKLCDIDSIAIPEELLDIHVEEQQVEAAVQSLSVRYAKEEAAEEVSQGDFVSCEADKESYPDGRTILIYTGMNLPGAEEAEAAVLGKKTNDTVSTNLAGKKAMLTIQKILHRIPVEVNDELIASIGMEGVTTVADYKDHIRAKMLEDVKMENSKGIISHLIQNMTIESTYQYDEAEMDAYVQSKMDQYLQEAKEAGEEVSPEEIKEGVLNQEKQGWMAEAFCKSKGIEVDLSSIEEDTDKMMEMMQLMGEEVPDRDEMNQMAVQDAYFGSMVAYISNMVEEKMGGSYGNC